LLRFVVNDHSGLLPAVVPSRFLTVYFDEEEDEDDEVEPLLVFRVSGRSCLRLTPATLPADRGFPTSDRALSNDTDKSFWTETGATERITAPSTVTATTSDLRISGSPLANYIN
jgi:hypothetical protein